LPSIRIDPEYFRRLARQDYRNWRMALAREFIQNSVDAGASNIHLRFCRDAKTLTVADDGCGMSRDVLENKLLCMGGTNKIGNGTLGCFGKAKEILFFGWESYRIITREDGGPTWRVDGVGSEYEVGRPAEELPHNGTICAIQFANAGEVEQTAVAVRRYLAWCETPCDVQLTEPSGRRLLYRAGVCPRLAGHALKREIILEGNGESWALLKVYESPKPRNFIPYMIRSRGVLMLSESRWVPGASQIVVVCEARASSRAIYTANREALIWEPYGRSLGKALDEATIDFKTYAENRQRQRRLFRGYGALLDRGNDLTGPLAGAASYLLDGYPGQRQRQVWLDERGREELLKQSGLKGIVAPRDFASAEALLQIVTDRLWNDGQPDMLVVGECGLEDLRDPRYVCIAKAWAELVRMLGEASDIPRLSIGFVFEENRRGLYLSFGRISFVMVNPMWALRLLDSGADPRKACWTLLFEACHEIAHHYSETHGEGFTIAASEIMERMASSPAEAAAFDRACGILAEGTYPCRTKQPPASC